MDYFDILLAKKLSGGGEITVEGLSVEENGTYTAPSGKAYSPVVVNLPLGEKSITANGEYLASADDLKGYSKVTVNVAGFTKKAMPTGAISSFNDGTANPLTKLKIAINPVQAGSGDPSPSNPRAISGWTGAKVTRCGKNLFDKSNAQNGKWINVNTGEIETQAGYTVTNFVKVKANTQYVFTNPQSSRRWLYDANKNPVEAMGNNNPYTPSQNGYIALTIANNSVDIDSFQIEQGSTLSTFEAYNGSTVPITWQTEAGTVYGGELDVTSGVLTEMWKSVDLSSLSWTKGAKGEDYSYFWATPSPLKNNEGNSDKFICSQYKSVYKNRENLNDCEIGVYNTNNETSRSRVTVRDDSYATYTAEQFASAMEGVQLVYLLEEYQTYQLTPTQVSSILGTNNIWADTGDVLEGEYFTSL